MAGIKISSFKLKGASMIANEKTKSPPVFNKIPEELKRYKQWVAWKAEQKGNGKPTKIPVNPNTGRYASTKQPHSSRWNWKAIQSLGSREYGKSGYQAPIRRWRSSR